HPDAWTESSLVSASNRARLEPLTCGCSLARKFHTSIETPTVRRVRARGLHVPKALSCRPGPLTRRPGREICRLESTGTLENATPKRQGRISIAPQIKGPKTPCKQREPYGVPRFTGDSVGAGDRCGKTAQLLGLGFPA